MAARLLAVATALSLSIACPVLAQDEPGLAPSTPWNLHYDDDSCALRRNFGSGENQVFLEFRRFAPGLSLQTVIASNRLKPRRQAQFRYRYGDGDWQSAGTPLTGTLADGFSTVVFSSSIVQLPELDEIEDTNEREAYFRTLDLKSLELEQAAMVDSITLRGAFGERLMVPLGKFDEPIGALHACIDELMTHWNIDVEAHRSLSRSAQPIDFADSASMVDYPPKMLRERLPGLVNVRLSIDETGKITDCHIQMPLTDPAFEESSCADIQHAFEFEPALDKDGNPIASYWTTVVYFRF